MQVTNRDQQKTKSVSPSVLANSLDKKLIIDKRILKVDDVVTQFGGREIGNSSDLRYAVGLVHPDTVTSLRYYREGLSYDIEVVIRPNAFERTVSVEASLNAVPIN